MLNMQENQYHKNGNQNSITIFFELIIFISILLSVVGANDRHHEPSVQCYTPVYSSESYVDFLSSHEF